MCFKLPKTIVPLLDEYTEMLITNFKDKIYGIYIYNSVALGAFIPYKSDIDILVILNSSFSEDEVKVLNSIHTHLRHCFPLGKYMEGMYLPIESIGKYNNSIQPYLYFYDGKLKLYGHYDINAVTWYTFKNYGIALKGPSTSYINLSVDYSDILKTMNYNLNTYWKIKSYKKLMYLTDTGVEFTVATLCRIIYTLDNKSITSKTAAINYVIYKYPSFSPLLLNETLRIRLSNAKNSLYSNRFSRAKDVRNFVKFIIDYCNNNYCELQLI